MDDGTSRELILNQLDEICSQGHFDACSQQSFWALQQQFGLEDGAILKALAPMPGIALRGETCGAVVGCLAALGLVFGPKHGDTVGPAREFCSRFEEELGSTRCGEILEARLGRRLDLADAEDFRHFTENGGLEHCIRLVRTAVRLAAEIMLDRAALLNG